MCLPICKLTKLISFFLKQDENGIIAHPVRNYYCKRQVQYSFTSHESRYKSLFASTIPQNVFFDIYFNNSHEKLVLCNDWLGAVQYNRKENQCPRTSGQ